MYIFTMAIIVILLLFVPGRMDYYYKRPLLLGNGILLCMGAVGGAIFYSMFRQVRSLWGKSGVDSDRMINVLTKVLFCVQI